MKILLLILGFIVLGMYIAFPSAISDQKPPWVLLKHKPTKEEVKAWVKLHKGKKPWKARTDTDLIQSGIVKNDTELKQVEKTEAEGYIDAMPEIYFQDYYDTQRVLNKSFIKIISAKLSPTQLHFIKLNPTQLLYYQMKVIELPAEEFFKINPVILKSLLGKKLFIEVVRIKAQQLSPTEIRNIPRYWFKQHLYKKLLFSGQYNELAKEVPELAKLISFRPKKAELKGFHVWEFEKDALHITELGADWETTLKPKPVIIVDYDFMSSEYVALGKFLRKYQDDIEIVIVGWDKFNNIDLPISQFPEAIKNIGAIVKVIKVFAPSIPVGCVICWKEKTLNQWGDLINKYPFDFYAFWVGRGDAKKHYWGASGYYGLIKHFSKEKPVIATGILSPRDKMFENKLKSYGWSGILYMEW